MSLLVGNYIAFGDYALQAHGNERITSRQIESARQAMTRYIKRGGKIWIRIFPHTPVTRKPQDVKMGSGKGNPEFFVAKVNPGTIMFEMQGVTEETAREAMRLAATSCRSRPSSSLGRTHHESSRTKG